MDRESALREIWRAELHARLKLLDRLIDEQASRTELVRNSGWEASQFERRSKLLQQTREHYVALLARLLNEGKHPERMWGDPDPEGSAGAPLGP